MSKNLEILEADAMKLAPSDRSHLLTRLVASLGVDPEVEAAWAFEADRRQLELDSGTATLVSVQRAMARLQSKFAK